MAKSPKLPFDPCPTKWCNVCEQYRPVGEFHTRRASDDGLGYTCKPCHSKRMRAWYLLHCDEVIATATAWNRANRERRRAIVAKSSKKHKARKNLSARRRRTLNPEAARLDGRHWAHIRRLRKLGATPRPFPKQWLQALIDVVETGVCLYCGEHRPLTLDHFVPIARGGLHEVGNLIPACKPCNSSKNDTLPQDYFSPDQMAGFKMFLQATREAFMELTEV